MLNSRKRASSSVCDRNGIDARLPNALAVETFYCSYHDIGPTVPKAAYNSLRWLESNIGLRVDTQLESPKRGTDHPEGHEPRTKTRGTQQCGWP